MKPQPSLRRAALPALRRRLAASAALLLAACASVPTLRFTQPVVLLGEVHDNQAQHRLRLQALEAWLASGARPALVMEQFDRERQGDIDRLRAQVPAADADALIAAAGGSGWAWPLYRPFIALALRHGLPIVAANVSRGDARRIMGQGLQASGFDARVPPQVLATLAQDIEDNHCGMLGTDAARRMALAQVARDQQMARAVEAHAARGAVLLAGNGHVRSDAGVPRWLSPATRARSEAIGLLEDDAPAAGVYDRVLRTPTQPRPDPCAATLNRGAGR